MIIQFNTDKTVASDQRNQDFFTTQIADELERFQSHLTRIEVHLSDETGTKEGSNNIQCVLEARLQDKKPIAVTCKDDSVEKAVSGAIEKLKNTLETKLGRIHNH